MFLSDYKQDELKLKSVPKCRFVKSDIRVNMKEEEIIMVFLLKKSKLTQKIRDKY